MANTKQIGLNFDGDPVSATLTRPTLPRRRQEVHRNSVEAYREELQNLSARAQLIFDHIAAAGPSIDRHVMRALGFYDMNAVRPRITEMIDANILRECGTMVDPVTGKRVRIVEVTP